MNCQIKLKKVWSYAPKLYKDITLKEASEAYYDYILFCISREDYDYKSFREWLETEI